MRALGVTLLTRWPTAPDIPPLNEAGVPGFDASGWFMMSGPAGTPKPIVERLHAELKAIMSMDDVQQAFNRVGVVPVVSPPLAELPKFIASEKERWGKVVTAGRTGGNAVAGLSASGMLQTSYPAGSMKMRIERSLMALIAGISLAATLAARADDYPSRPVTLILPLGAGGAMDILARAQFEPKLKERLGKPIIIENRTGGGTVIAATATAKSPPDGHTLFLAPAGTLTTNATLYKKLPYDPGKDFMPIALTSSVAFVLVVHPSLPVHSVKELVAYVKERPGQLAFGSTGIGATPHLAFEMMMRDAGLKMTHVPYRGMPQAVNDVVGNHVQMVFADPAGAPPLIKDGKLRPLAVSSRTRIDSMPDVPTMEEAGFKGFEAVSWHMIVGPAGMPKEIVTRLNGEFKRIATSADFKAQVDQDGTDRDRFAAAGRAQEISRQGDRELGQAREGRRDRGHGMTWFGCHCSHGRSLPVFAAALIALASPAASQTQDYPNRAVTIVAPAAPGGLYSLFARLIGASSSSGSANHSSSRTGRARARSSARCR